MYIYIKMYETCITMKYVPQKKTIKRVLTLL